MRRITVLILASLTVLGIPSAGAEEPAAETDPASGVRRTVLPNGMTVLVLPRPAAPTVAVNVWYRVGSADERQGERGLAHFLEHLMFKGTDRLPKGEIDALTHRNGGQNNAFTSHDVTVYHFTFAPDRWETALEIEADRMRNTVFDPEEFELERGVVLEELKTGLDEPWDALDDTLIGTAFRVHPYRHPVIGYATDLERVSREDVLAFYRRHYTPANATLVVAGRVEPEAALKAVRKAFAGVKGPAAPEVYRTPEPPQTGERRIVSRKETASTDRFEMVWHTCAASHDDDPALDVVRALLSVGRSSRLHARLVDDEGLLTDVTASNDTRRDPGLFWVWGELTQGAEIGRVEGIVVEEVRRLHDAKRIGSEEMSRARAQAEAAIVFGRETSDGAAEEIGWLTIGASWRSFGKRLERIRAVTAEDVARVASTYLHPDNRTFGHGTGPREKPRRDDEEKVGPAVALSPVRVVLPNGLILLVQPKTEASVVAVRAHVRAGRMVEARPGLAHLTGEMLLAGAGERDRLEIAQAIEGVGGSVDSSATTVRARALARDLPLVLEIVADALRRPTFPEDEIERTRDRVLSELQAEQDSPETIARRRFAALAYGTGHPLGRNPRGTTDDVKGTTLAHVKAHHQTWFRPDNTVLAVTGDVDPAAVTELVRKRFGDWARAKLPDRPSGDVELPAKPIRDRIERPGRQVNVYLGHAGIRRNHPDYAALKVLDNILGWSPVFSDRLSRELRENRGLCYSTWAAISRSAGSEPGLFTAFVATSPKTAEEAVRAMREEIERIRREPVTEEELGSARSHLSGSWVFLYETAEQIAERLVELERWGVGFDAPQKLVEAIDGVTREDVQRVAREHLRPDRLVIVEVGPGS